MTPSSFRVHCAVKQERGSATDDDVHQAAGDDDDFLDRFARGLLGHLRRGAGDGFDLGAVASFFTTILSRTFPFTCTGSSISSSMRSAGSYAGQAASASGLRF